MNLRRVIVHAGRALPSAFRGTGRHDLTGTSRCRARKERLAVLGQWLRIMIVVMRAMTEMMIVMMVVMMMMVMMV